MEDKQFTEFIDVLLSDFQKNIPDSLVPTFKKLRRVISEYITRAYIQYFPNDKLKIQSDICVIIAVKAYDEFVQTKNKKERQCLDAIRDIAVKTVKAQK